MGKGGGGQAAPAPPPPPDYAAAAKETAAGNLAAANYATNANRINQYTPYGSLTYSRTSKAPDYAGYNAALQAYNQQKAQQPSAGTSQPGLVYDPGRTVMGENGVFESTYGNHFKPGINDQAGGGGASYGPAPRLEDFMPSDDGSGWSQTMSLTPEAQAALDQQLALNRKYGEVANIGFDKTRKLFENPELDTSGLTPRAINPGQTAQQAIMSRMSPQLARQEEELRTRMANQGITLGSQAYNTEQNLQGQRRNDLEMQAALQGISLDQNNRSSALQEQAYLQDRPLNLINALRSGNQVQAPQFQQFAQQQTTQGPDMLGAASAGYGAAMNGYNAQMDSYNAGQAADSGMMSGLFGLAGSAMGGPLGGMLGNAIGGAAGGGGGGGWTGGGFKVR